MKITPYTEGKAAYLLLRGDFDSFERHPFVRQIQELADKGYKEVTLDMNAVTLFGSRAVIAVLRARVILHRAGGELQVVYPSIHVRETLEALGLTKLILGPSGIVSLPETKAA